MESLFDYPGYLKFIKTTKDSESKRDRLDVDNTKEIAVMIQLLRTT